MRIGIGLCQVALARRDPGLVRVLDTVTLPLPLWIVMHEDLKTSARYHVVFDALTTAVFANVHTGLNQDE